MSDSRKAIPRPEYPRPQFARADWINLNGLWSFCFDFGMSGMDRRLFESKGFEARIRVPFCPESALSGVGHTDFIRAMWYHRKIQIPRTWSGHDVLIHFGAVDYEGELFLDGVSVGTHFGGTVSFSFDITRHVTIGGTHDLILRVADNLQTDKQPSGKQSQVYRSMGCHYLADGLDGACRAAGIEECADRARPGWKTVCCDAPLPASGTRTNVPCQRQGRRSNGVTGRGAGV